MTSVGYSPRSQFVPRVPPPTRHSGDTGACLYERGRNRKALPQEPGRAAVGIVCTESVGELCQPPPTGRDRFAGAGSGAGGLCGGGVAGSGRPLKCFAFARLSFFILLKVVRSAQFAVATDTPPHVSDDGLAPSFTCTCSSLREPNSPVQQFSHRRRYCVGGSGSISPRGRNRGFPLRGLCRRAWHNPVATRSGS